MSIKAPRRVGRRLFSVVLDKGISANSNLFSVRYLNSSVFHGELPQYQGLSSFSFVVSKKVSKKAVVRNKLKRRGRYAINKLIGRIKEGFVLLFFFRPQAVDVPYSVLDSNINEILAKIGAIK
ncbi:MAG: ribonuclease P protein component [Candidatus Paceibacterota bacterium]|jgi:ribonuclease P protein component